MTILKKHHGGNLNINNFKMQITGGFKKPLPRIIAEGIKLDNLIKEREEKKKKIIVINTNQNFHQAKRIKFKASSTII